MQHIHLNLIEAVASALEQIFFHGWYADKVIQRVIKSNPKWGARDRKFIAETTYDIVRFWRLFHEICGTYNSISSETLPSVIAVYLYFKGFEENVYVKKHLPPGDLRSKRNALEINRAARESIPDWLDKMGETELGERWDSELKALNAQADVIIRANTLKTTRESLIDELKKESIDTLPLKQNSTALQLVNRVNLFTSNAFKEGYFEVQDTGSQEVGSFTGVKPGMRVIDACAGGGGKSLHLAALMRNKGRIIAMDTEEKKLEELKRRARRCGVSIIETRVIESTKSVKRLAQSADLVLLDVPCSGSGVIRRNPDAKWKLSIEKIEGLIKLQSDILQQYACMVKPGGVLVYSTCSLFPSENIRQVEKFLNANKNFTLSAHEEFTPAVHGCDGFFMAKMNLGSEELA